jgi:hypothetical protein
MPGAGAKHDQQAVAAGRTWLTGAQGGAPAIGRRALPGRGCGRRLGCVPRQRALELVQERTMAGTPQPLVPDLVDALGQYVRQQAAATRLGRERHRGPTRGLSVRSAKADRAILDGEQPVVGQRAPMDRPAQVGQDRLWTVDGGGAVDAPARGPDGLGSGQVRPFLTSQGPKPPPQELRPGLDGHAVGRAGRPPRGPVGGDPTGRDEAVHGRLLDQGAGPGLQPTQDAAPTAAIMRGRGQRDERLGRRAAQAGVAVLLMTPDARTELMGHGDDHVNVGDR